MLPVHVRRKEVGIGFTLMPKSGRCALAYLFAGLYVQSVAVIVSSVVRSGSRAALNACLC